MSSDNSNTAFVLVPGSFSPPFFYHKVVPLLQSRGYLAIPTALQSAGERSQGPASFAEDVSYLATTIKTLADEGKDVILVMNSYSGFPGTESTKGLSKRERTAQGSKGGIIALVYLASFLPGIGKGLRGKTGEDLPDSTKKSGDYMTLNYEEDWKNFLVIWGKGRLGNIETTYFLTEGDRVASPESQEEMVEKVRGLGGTVKVVRSKAGHVPMLSQPEEVVSVLFQAAEGK